MQKNIKYEHIYIHIECRRILQVFKVTYYNTSLHLLGKYISHHLVSLGILSYGLTIYPLIWSHHFSSRMVSPLLCHLSNTPNFPLILTPQLKISWMLRTFPRVSFFIFGFMKRHFLVASSISFGLRKIRPSKTTIKTKKLEQLKNIAIKLPQIAHLQSPFLV